MPKKTFSFRLEENNNFLLQHLADVYCEGNRTEMLERMIKALDYLCRHDSEDGDRYVFSDDETKLASSVVKSWLRW